MIQVSRIMAEEYRKMFKEHGYLSVEVPVVRFDIENWRRTTTYIHCLVEHEHFQMGGEIAKDAVLAALSESSNTTTKTDMGDFTTYLSQGDRFRGVVFDTKLKIERDRYGIRNYKGEYDPRHDEIQNIALATVVFTAGFYDTNALWFESSRWSPDFSWRIDATDFNLMIERQMFYNEYYDLGMASVQEYTPSDIRLLIPEVV